MVQSTGAVVVALELELVEIDPSFEVLDVLEVLKVLVVVVGMVVVVVVVVVVVPQSPGRCKQRVEQNPLDAIQDAREPPQS